MTDKPIPVSVITGFLGAGKTSLLNHLLHADHGMRLAVIVNEFGEQGIDGHLLASGDEEIFEMNNGCVCCSVRGDLVRTLHGLLPRLSEFDGIVLETTGLAKPGPIAQTFLIDDILRERITLDSVICVADAVHLEDGLGREEEVAAQIAFADLIVLNKTDLVSKDRAAELRQHLHAINPEAEILQSIRGVVPVDKLLSRKAFLLEQVADELQRQTAPQCGPDCGHVHHHYHDHGHGHDLGHDQHHQGITSVSLRLSGAFDAGKVSDWLGSYLGENGIDTLRVKGILHAKGEDRPLVFQAVHMLLEGDFLEPWPEGDPRLSRIVFIGRNLDQPKLQADFEACRA